jgi:hypothetical protein
VALLTTDNVCSAARVLLVMAPSEDFAAGVMALAHALGADVQLPPRRDVVPVVVTIDANGREVAR